MNILPGDARHSICRFCSSAPSFRKKSGTPCWKSLTLGWMAKRIGNPKAVRAVGTANGSNSISIFAPCHRIIGSNGSLTGYGGGLPAKKFLLELEGVKL